MDNSIQSDAEHRDIYPSRLLDGRVYREVTSKTIDLAFSSYRAARLLSILTFVVGMLLLISAAVVGYFNRDSLWVSAAFAALGTLDIIALLFVSPIDRIQSGINELMRAQITCLNFAAAYESIARYLIASSELPFDDSNRDLHMEFERAKFLMDSALVSISISSSQPASD